MSKEYSINVTEVNNFAEAWEKGSTTRESYAGYQGMEQKKGFIEKADRWFIDEEANIWFSYFTNDRLRVIDKAQVHSMISNANYQYVQLMVAPESVNPERTGRLRFSGQFTDRKGAIKTSADGEAFAFHK
jgi:uncharacterized protein (DUF952 family)